jgi:hypothetical protein
MFLSLTIRRNDMHAVGQVIEKLKRSGSIELEDLKSLKANELESFAEEIQHWCVYGNSIPEKLGQRLGAQSQSAGGGNLESN